MYPNLAPYGHVTWRGIAGLVCGDSRHPGNQRPGFPRNREFPQFVALWYCSGMRGLLYLCLTTIACGPVSACGLALALAVDISGSVDREEFKIQMDGLAAGLRDGVIADALAAEKARVVKQR